MNPRWWALSDQERIVYRAALVFLENRLEDRSTIDWALGLTHRDLPQRFAILDLCNNRSGKELTEPWRTGWGLIAESWATSGLQEPGSTAEYHAQRRIQASDRSGALVEVIVERVAPRLKVAAFSKLHLSYAKPPARPKQVEHLFSTTLTSGPSVDPEVLKLSDISEPDFLLALVNALDNSITTGFDIARRIGWDGERRSWKLGEIRRVYYVPASDLPPGAHEPDRYNKGISPATKLLHATVDRLFQVDRKTALEIIMRWRVCRDPIRMRLWAAFARSRDIADGKEVLRFLRSLNSRQFWDVNEFPELAELRSVRFADFELEDQCLITAKLRRKPPKYLWPKNAPRERVDGARNYWVVRELQRIRAAGARLPADDQLWHDGALADFPQLAAITRIDQDFPEAPQARLVPDTPDRKYDSLAGHARLRALEAGLATARKSWEDDPAKGAEGWIGQAANADLLISDFEEAGDNAKDFPKVWERFGWVHRPSDQLADGEKRTVSGRVVSLLSELRSQQ